MEYIQEVIATEHPCPICQTKVVQNGAVMKCPSCEFTVWTIQGGIRMNKKEIDDFFTKHITGVRKMKKKDGGTFEAMVAVDFENKGSRFVFPKRK